MKAITLWQPWASLWLTTRKVHETRSWRTKYRGELAVHAAKAVIGEEHLTRSLIDICCDEFGGHWQMDLPRGSIIGVVHLLDCYSSNDNLPIDNNDAACGDFGMGRWLWKRGQFLTLAQPLPIAGKQGLWNGPKQVLGQG